MENTLVLEGNKTSSGLISYMYPSHIIIIGINTSWKLKSWEQTTGGSTGVVSNIREI